MIHLERTFLSCFVLAILATPACSTAKKVNAVLDNANKTAENVQQLTKNFNETLNQLKAQAKQAASTSPVATASVPKLPQASTGGVDVGKTMSGKSGTAQADIDGSGTPETVQVFEPDAASDGAPPTDTTGTGTNGQSARVHVRDFAVSDEATTFLAWKGDAESGDEGTCYLGWEHAGKVWYEIAACDQATGYVCSDDGTNVSCSACNEEGTCTPCDDNAPLDSCKVASNAESNGDHDGGEAP